MRVALLHYHLTRGGVTTVLRHQARSLAESGDEVLIITGEVSEGIDPCEGCSGKVEFSLVPALRYDSKLERPRSEAGAAADELASAIMAAMVSHWGAAADLLHVHNPLIKKNSALVPALRKLQADGVKLLLQEHDFAEDYRPDVYLKNEPYPEDCHYAAINGRDLSFLRRAGLDESGAHYLANAVTPLEATEGLARTRYLYPVRGIRRKNLGEALLLSLFIPEGRTVAVTLPPTSAVDLPSYDHWRDLAKRLDLRVEFEVGSSESLKNLMGTSVAVLTTSIKEGFGFSFLEPWTAGRATIGRRIDYVCEDFERQGVRFDCFYDSMDVPLVYLPAPLLRRKLQDALVRTYRSFGAELPQFALKRMTDDLFARDVFDFGRLDEELQTEVIETMAQNGTARDDMAEANPILDSIASWEPDEALISANRDRILSAFGERSSVERLRAAHRAVLEHPVRQRLSRAMLLELFLDPERLSLVGLGHD